MAINNTLWKNRSPIRTHFVTSSVNFKSSKYSPENVKDVVQLSLKPLSREDVNRWEDSVTNVCQNNFKGLDITKNLSDTEREELIQSLSRCCDIEPFLLMATGGRPAMSTIIPPSLKKINTAEYNILANPKYDDKYGFIFNKKSMLENIGANKAFYIKRLNLPSDTSNEKIYNVLTSADSPLSDVINYQDVIGTMFGYPFKNTVIFQLEADAGMRSNILQSRRNVSDYKVRLSQALLDKDSRYNSLGKDFKDDMQKSINSITWVEPSNRHNYPIGYTFMRSVEEPAEAARIGKKVRESTMQLEGLNNIAKEQQLLKELNEIRKIGNNRKEYWDI